MEKTYYKNLVFYEAHGHWVCKFEFSDDPEGFFMPIIFESQTREKVEEKFNRFVGTESVKIERQCNQVLAK